MQPWMLRLSQKVVTGIIGFSAHCLRKHVGTESCVRLRVVPRAESAWLLDRRSVGARDGAVEIRAGMML